MGYSLMIADDDAMIRKGLSCLIPWKELGFDLAGIFEDGKALLESLDKHPADVVLTDIRMHEVSGLEVARRIYTQKLPTRVVILSGYQEFDYAQQAIRYDVKEYLSKPISIDMLRDTFSRIKLELDQAYGEQARRNKLASHLSSLEERIEKLFLMDAYAGLLIPEAAFQQRCQLNDYSPSEWERPSVLFTVECPPGVSATIAEALGLIDETYSFYALKEREDVVEGLLLKRKRCDPGENAISAELIEQRLTHLTGWQVHVDRLVPFANLRQFSLMRQPVSSAEADGPAAQAESYLRAHYAKEITLNDVAAQIYVNPVYLSRIFHQKTGRTFTEALTHIRLEAARRMLLESGAFVSAIARQCGYEDSKYFYRQFKRYTGLSPGEWRRKNGERRGT